jgi:hypothetical protein
MKQIDQDTQNLLRGATRERLAIAVIHMAEEIAHLRCELSRAHWEKTGLPLIIGVNSGVPS